MIRPPRHLRDFAGIRPCDPEPCGCSWQPLVWGVVAGALIWLAILMLTAGTVE